MPSIDDVLADAENPKYVRTASVRILLRQDLLERLAELEDERRQLVDDDGLEVNPRIGELDLVLDELGDEIEQAKVEFRFRSIGKKAWADLLAEHPPTREQIAAERERARAAGRLPDVLDHDPDTFPAAAIAAACVEPDGVTLEKVQRLEQALNQSQFTLLWRACIDANVGGVTDPKRRRRSGQTARPNDESVTTAALEESPAPSS